jgi:hypothetical protein
MNEGDGIMTTIAPREVGSPAAIGTPMLPFLQGTHAHWLQEVGSVLAPARDQTAGIWLRWRAIGYLETGFKRRFERERQAVNSMHDRLAGRQAGHLWVAGELVGQLLENMRHHTGLCHHAAQFSASALTIMKVLEYWCREVEESLGPVRWGEVPTESRALFETITYDATTLGS